MLTNVSAADGRLVTFSSYELYEIAIRKSDIVHGLGMEYLGNRWGLTFQQRLHVLYDFTIIGGDVPFCKLDHFIVADQLGLQMCRIVFAMQSSDGFCILSQWNTHPFV